MKQELSKLLQTKSTKAQSEGERMKGPAKMVPHPGADRRQGDQNIYESESSGGQRPPVFQDPSAYKPIRIQVVWAEMTGLTDDQLAFLKNDLVPNAVAILERALRVIPVSSPGFHTSRQCMQATNGPVPASDGGNDEIQCEHETTSCGDATLPPEYFGENYVTFFKYMGKYYQFNSDPGYGAARWQPEPEPRP